MWRSFTRTKKCLKDFLYMRSPWKFNPKIFLKAEMDFSVSFVLSTIALYSCILYSVFRRSGVSIFTFDEKDIVTRRNSLSSSWAVFQEFLFSWALYFNLNASHSSALPHHFSPILSFPMFPQLATIADLPSTIMPNPIIAGAERGVFARVFVPHLCKNYTH